VDARGEREAPACLVLVRERELMTGERERKGADNASAGGRRLLKLFYINFSSVFFAFSVFLRESLFFSSAQWCLPPAATCLATATCSGLSAAVQAIPCTVFFFGRCKCSLVPQFFIVLIAPLIGFKTYDFVQLYPRLNFKSALTLRTLFILVLDF
jgi:hypothetical protein